MHRLTILSFILLWALFGSRLCAQAEQFTASVIGISDGDTIQILHQGASKRVRLWGIDCPEAGQPFGTKARQFTGALAFGKVVTLLVRDVDRYGRKVAEVTLPDGRKLNQEIVRAGFAWWYVKYARQDGELRRLEAEAKAGKRGLWADSNPMPPWEYRQRPPTTVPKPQDGLRAAPAGPEEAN